MKRIVIFGNSGSGKSTLAKHLKAMYNIPHLDLDTLAWRDTKPPGRQPLEKSKQTINQFIEGHQSWVIEGCYADLISMAVKHANTAVYMDLSVTDCQKNAQKRPWEPHKYASKIEQDANLDMLLEWIAAYRTRDDEFSHQAHESLYQNFPQKKIRMTENQSCFDVLI